MWLSECCSSEPDYDFPIHGKDRGIPSGICSNCQEHCSLIYDGGEDDD